MDGLVLMTKKDGSAAATLELNPTHGRITFGRGADCDVRIQRVTVSALHCEMLHDGHRWCLRHLSEMNNTNLNGEPMELNALVPLRDGDIIQISKRVFRFQRGVGENAAPVVEASPGKAGSRSEVKRARAAASPEASRKSATPQSMPAPRSHPLDHDKMSPPLMGVESVTSPRRSSRVATPVKTTPLAVAEANDVAARGLPTPVLGTPSKRGVSLMGVTFSPSKRGDSMLGVTFSPAMSPRRATPVLAAPAVAVEEPLPVVDAMDVSNDGNDDVKDDVDDVGDVNQPKSAVARGFRAIAQILAHVPPSTTESAFLGPRRRSDSGEDISDGVPDAKREESATKSRRTPVERQKTPRSAKRRSTASKPKSSKSASRATARKGVTPASRAAASQQEDEPATINKRQRGKNSTTPSMAPATTSKKAKLGTPVRAAEPLTTPVNTALPESAVASHRRASGRSAAPVVARPAMTPPRAGSLFMEVPQVAAPYIAISESPPLEAEVASQRVAVAPMSRTPAAAAVAVALEAPVSAAQPAAAVTPVTGRRSVARPSGILSPARTPAQQQQGGGDDAVETTPTSSRRAAARPAASASRTPAAASSAVTPAKPPAAPTLRTPAAEAETPAPAPVSAAKSVAKSAAKSAAKSVAKSAAKANTDATPKTTVTPRSSLRTSLRTPMAVAAASSARVTPQSGRSAAAISAAMQQDALKTAFEAVMRAVSDLEFEGESLYGVFQHVPGSPSYHAVVEQPMAVAIIASKVQSGAYKDAMAFLADWKLLCNNASQYYDADTFESGAAALVEKTVTRLLAHAFPDEMAAAAAPNAGKHERSGRRVGGSAAVPIVAPVAAPVAAAPDVDVAATAEQRAIALRSKTVKVLREMAYKAGLTPTAKWVKDDYVGALLVGVATRPVESLWHLSKAQVEVLAVRRGLVAAPAARALTKKALLELVREQFKNRPELSDQFPAPPVHSNKSAAASDADGDEGGDDDDHDDDGEAIKKAEAAKAAASKRKAAATPPRKRAVDTGAQPDADAPSASKKRAVTSTVEVEVTSVTPRSAAKKKVHIVAPPTPASGNKAKANAPGADAGDGESPAEMKAKIMAMPWPTLQRFGKATLAKCPPTKQQILEALFKHFQCP